MLVLLHPLAPQPFTLGSCGAETYWDRCAVSMLRKYFQVEFSDQKALQEVTFSRLDLLGNHLFLNSGDLICVVACE